MERIYVTVRARPLSPEDAKSSPWRLAGNSISLLPSQTTKFDCDRIFGEDCKTIEVYEARTKEIVASAVRGFNGTVFAYGQTSSGKTHTMRGSVTEPGIIPLAVHDLFRSIEEDVDREFLVRMSYMEIYNEEINDLLAPEHRKLQVHESIERGIYVAGLREEIVATPEQVLDFMEFGESHRHIGQTNMNVYSSRSHTIFRMIVESREKREDDETDNSCDAVRVSFLNLVDLAGSERVAKTGAEGMRLKEGSHINKSLLTLGTVIKKLSEGAESQGGHVPYRDSKLTRILQPALGGNSNTAIICNITLAQVHADETKSTLQFASRALRVTNCACVNEILTDAALLRRQRKEIEELRAKLLSSNSEHFGEEILNLRNTLLQSELEKERIALELEEEKKAKAHRERRLLEQAKKIANLSSLVLCSERDETSTYPRKNRRRVTWCPGPFLQKLKDEVSSLDQATASGEAERDMRDMGLPPPFEELMQESEVSIDGTNSDTCVPDCIENNNHMDDFSLPDAGALFRVTSRRKMRLKRVDLPLENDASVEKHQENKVKTIDYEIQKKLENVEVEGLVNMFMESDCTSSRRCTSSMCDISGSAFHGHKSLTTRESEAILLIKQLEDKIKTLEMEKTFIQKNLDNVVDLATQQNASFRETYEELNQEVLKEREKARVAHEEHCSVASTGSYQEVQIHKIYLADMSQEVQVVSTVTLSTEIQGLALQIDDSRNVVETMFSIIEDLFLDYVHLSEFLQEFKLLARQDLMQFNSIIDGHKKIDTSFRKRIDEIEFEKNLLSSQSVDHKKQIQELNAQLDNLEKAMTEQGLQHDLEKDGLLCQILNLQREVSCLSSSSLTREKESLRKELDKTKSKLKDTESKLRNTIQDKNKLESEKAQAEREIKNLHSQRSVLERDMLKRDSLIDKRHETKSFDFSKGRGPVAAPEQTLQEDYKNLEVYAFEMESEIAALNEALMSATREMEQACSLNVALESDLEKMSNKLNIANSETQLLKEELASMMQRLEESKSFSEKMEVTVSLLSREKEEMAMQLADAFLDVEAEKSTWLAKEKTFIESNERLQLLNDETARLSEDLSEVRLELESCRGECRELRERLTLFEDIAEREKECSTSKSLEITQLRNELKQYMVSSAERDDVNGMGIGSDLSDEYQNLKTQLLLTTKEKEDLFCQNEELKTVLAEVEISKRKYGDMLSAARIDVEKMAGRISSMEVKMHDEALHKNKETAKLRMRLRAVQARLDAFRGRYEKAMDEMGLMDKNFEEASSKLKKQLASYGVEILRLKKELASKD